MAPLGFPTVWRATVNAYLSALDAKEERVERFKTGYAVVRNSTRYLPLAAANVTRQAQESGEEALARAVAVLVQDMNSYLSNPTETTGTRLGEELARLREGRACRIRRRWPMGWPTWSRTRRC